MRIGRYFMYYIIMLQYSDTYVLDFDLKTLSIRKYYTSL